MTDTITAKNILDGLKIRAGQNEDTGNYSILILVERDPLLARLVAAWPNVLRPQDENPEEQCPPELSPDKRLRWLWSRFPDELYATWARLAGLPFAAHTERVQWVAIENRMVLPDGTLAPALRGYIQGIAVQAARRLAPQAKKTEKAEEKDKKKST
jgi:hypothetical protein